MGGFVWIVCEMYVSTKYTTVVFFIFYGAAPPHQNNRQLTPPSSFPANSFFFLFHECVDQVYLFLAEIKTYIW